jgi:hypothetical protein
MSAAVTSTRSKYIKWAVIGGVILTVLILIISLFSTINTVRNEGIAREAALTAQYKVNKDELSKYTAQFTESLGVADKGNDKLNKILSEAVQGRYDGNMEPGDTGSMFSAIQEAYPDLTATAESYAKVQDLVVSGRDSYSTKQSKLVDMVREFDEWKKSGLIKSQIVSTIGFPSNDLRVTDAGVTYRGQEALDRMDRVIVTEEAEEAYDSGTIKPMIQPDSGDTE